MEIKLIQGEFSPIDALELIVQMVNIKIKYHENQINNNENEEDIKTREVKIKRLQKDLYELKNLINLKTDCIRIKSTIKIE